MFDQLCSDTKPEMDTLGIYVEITRVDVEHSSFGHDLTIGNLVNRGLCQTCGRTPRFLKLGALLLQRGGCAKHSPHMRSTEIHKKYLENNVLEHEPGHVWTLSNVSGITKHDI